MTINLAESLQAFLIGCIDEQEWIDLTVEMVAIGQPNSTNPLDPDIPAGEEEAYALFVAGKLEAMGFKVKKYASQSKRPNIVGVLKGEGGGPSLMINDHLDTYPAVEPERWDKCDGDPFKATRHGDWIYGRGTSDTRANLAASLLAVKAVLDSGVRLKGDLICCYTVDEEKDGGSRLDLPHQNHRHQGRPLHHHRAHSLGQERRGLGHEPVGGQLRTLLGAACGARNQIAHLASGYRR